MKEGNGRMRERIERVGFQGKECRNEVENVVHQYTCKAGTNFGANGG